MHRVRSLGCRRPRAKYYVGSDHNYMQPAPHSHTSTCITQWSALWPATGSWYVFDIMWGCCTLAHHCHHTAAVQLLGLQGHWHATHLFKFPQGMTLWLGMTGQHTSTAVTRLYLEHSQLYSFSILAWCCKSCVYNYNIVTHFVVYIDWTSLALLSYSKEQVIFLHLNNSTEVRNTRSVEETLWRYTDIATFSCWLSWSVMKSLHTQKPFHLSSECATLLFLWSCIFWSRCRHYC